MNSPQCKGKGLIQFAVEICVIKKLTARERILGYIEGAAKHRTTVAVISEVRTLIIDTSTEKDSVIYTDGSAFSVRAVHGLLQLNVEGKRTRSVGLMLKLQAIWPRRHRQ